MEESTLGSTMNADEKKVWRIILLGRTGVGKSSLVRRLADSSFDPEYVCTQGYYETRIKFKIAQGVPGVGGEDVLMDVVDTAGAESPRRLAPWHVPNRFYEGADGALVMFDLARNRTLQHGMDFMPDVRAVAGDRTRYVFVGSRNESEPTVRDRELDSAVRERGYVIEETYFKMSLKNDSMAQFLEPFTKLARRFLDNPSLEFVSCEQESTNDDESNDSRAAGSLPAFSEVPLPQNHVEEQREMDLPTAILRGASLEEIQEMITSNQEALRRPDRFGELPVHVAARRNSSTDVIRLLVTEYPAALEAQDNQGRTPLHVALSRFCPLPTLQYLARERPAALQIQNADGQTPLHVAASVYCPLETIEFLANLSPQALRVTDRNGRLPLHLAVRVGQLDIVQMLATLFLDAIGERDRDGQPPFHLAVARGHLGIVQMLATVSPAAIRVRDGSGQPPMHFAVARGHLGIVQMLATVSPVAVRVRDGNGQPPLHFAVARGQLDMVQILASPEALLVPDDNGRLPFYFAAESGASLDVLYVLLGNFLDEFLKLPAPRYSL